MRIRLYILPDWLWYDQIDLNYGMVGTIGTSMFSAILLRRIIFTASHEKEILNENGVYF